MQTKGNTPLTRALQIARDGIQVYRLATNSKVPLKGTHGYEDATTDEATIIEWFNQEPTANLAIRLDTANLLVVDIDKHGTTDGTATLRELSQQGKQLPSDTRIERTPNNGLHYFFKCPVELAVKRQVAIYKGIDVLNDYVLVAPSSINGSQYEIIDDSQTIADAPNWLLNDLQPTIKFKNTRQKRKKIIKNWTGLLLDELIAGTSEGERNTFLTHLAGKILYTGCEGETAYELLQYANEHVTPPLPEKELNKIFLSICKRM